MLDHAADAGDLQQPVIEVRDVEPSDQQWMKSFLLAHNHSLRVVTRGRLHQALELPGLIASYNREPSALLTYHVAHHV